MRWEVESARQKLYDSPCRCLRCPGATLTPNPDAAQISAPTEDWPPRPGLDTTHPRTARNAREDSYQKSERRSAFVVHSRTRGDEVMSKAIKVPSSGIPPIITKPRRREAAG